MRYDLIKSVTLHTLDKTRGNRRGAIATFEMERVHNVSYRQQEGIKILMTLTSLLSRNFITALEEKTATHVETNNCWINVEAGRSANGLPQAIVWHKYWTEEQIDAFQKILKIMAKLHGWEIKPAEQGQHNPGHRKQPPHTGSNVTGKEC